MPEYKSADIDELTSKYNDELGQPLADAIANVIKTAGERDVAIHMVFAGENLKAKECTVFGSVATPSAVLKKLHENNPEVAHFIMDMLRRTDEFSKDKDEDPVQEFMRMMKRIMDADKASRH